MRKSRKNKFIKKRGGKGSLSRDNDDNLKTKDSSSESTLGYGSNNNETTPEAELNDPKKLPKRITKDTPKGGLEESSEEDSEGDSSSPENAEAKKRVVVAEAVSSISAELIPKDLSSVKCENIGYSCKLYENVTIEDANYRMIIPDKNLFLREGHESGKTEEASINLAFICSSPLPESEEVSIDEVESVQEKIDVQNESPLGTFLNEIVVYKITQKSNEITFKYRVDLQTILTEVKLFSIWDFLKFLLFINPIIRNFNLTKCLHTLNLKMSFYIKTLALVSYFLIYNTNSFNPQQLLTDVLALIPSSDKLRTYVLSDIFSKIPKHLIDFTSPVMKLYLSEQELFSPSTKLLSMYTFYKSILMFYSFLTNGQKWVDFFIGLSSRSLDLVNYKNLLLVEGNRNYFSPNTSITEHLEFSSECINMKKGIFENEQVNIKEFDKQNFWKILENILNSFTINLSLLSQYLIERTKINLETILSVPKEFTQNIKEWTEGFRDLNFKEICFSKKTILTGIFAAVAAGYLFSKRSSGGKSTKRKKIKSRKFSKKNLVSKRSKKIVKKKSIKRRK